MATFIISRASALWAAVQRGALRRSPAARRWLLALVALVVFRYHWWRVTQTLLLELSVAAALVWAFYALELFSAYCRLDRSRLFVGTSDRRPDVEANLRWYGRSEHAPLIDVLIPTYNESRALLRVTILAATRLDYPRYRVWILDDGRRPWLVELCSELGANYICRDERIQFKAGNLNHALWSLLTESERPEYVAVLDADCVAYPTFLQRTLALMRDPGVAIVQTPQHFYNPDPFQYAFDAHAVWPEEWRVVDFVLTSLDAKGRASCFGTAFLARVEALQAVQGFPTDSLLEDALLSKRLAKIGWRTIYLNERLSVGRNVESLADLQRQRWRWHVGEMQILLQDWLAIGPGLALLARFRWLKALLAWFADPAIRLSWVVAPIIYWFTGVAIVRASTEDVLSYCLPMLVAPQVVMFWLSGGAVMPLASQAAGLLFAPGRIAAGLTALVGRGGREFFVTPKGIERRAVHVHGPTLVWTGLLLLALVTGVTHRLVSSGADAIGDAFFFWNAAATGLLIIVLWVTMTSCIERPRYRKAERYPHGGRASFIQGGVRRDCALHDLSVAGARISLPGAAALGGDARLALSAQLELPARVVRETGSGEIGLEFLPTREQEVELIHLVLCSRTYVPQPERWRWWRFCAAVVRGAVGVRAPAPRLEGEFTVSS
jgi:cellulose synthase/poly-beta-1,6-N-acetylglucosamine synthase-like glycosyltransferase